MRFFLAVAGVFMALGLFMPPSSGGVPIGSRTAVPVVIDVGDEGASGGFNVAVTTAATVLLSSSATNVNHRWRIRTFQNNDGPYAIWVGTHSNLTFNSGNGWVITGSSGSWTTRSQDAYYGILDPAAGSATQNIHGPYHYEPGEVHR